ncbi:MAG: IclR family transcriptional regulator [Pseudomonadota bacterium]
MLDSQADKQRRGRVQSIEVGGLLLEQLIELGGPTSLTELAHKCDMQPAKAHRYLASLNEIGLVRQDQVSGKYGLGSLALRMGLAAMSQNDIVDRAAELMSDMCYKFEISAHQAIWSERGPVVIHRANGAPPIISPLGIGAMMPLLRSATGFIFYVYMPKAATKDVFVEQIVQQQTNAEDIDSLASETRSNGYCVIAGGYVPGLNAIAYPIFAQDGSLACSLTFISSNMELFDPDKKMTNQLGMEIQKFHTQWNL